MEEPPSSKKKKPPNRERSKQINIRLNQSEVELLQKNIDKSKLNQNEFIRKSILEKNIIVIEEIKDLMSELKRVGNNLNQITRLINSGDIKDSKELAEIKSNLENVWKEIIKSLKKVNE